LPQLFCVFRCRNKSFIAPHLASVKKCLTFSSDVSCGSWRRQEKCTGISWSKTESQPYCSKWKLLPRMFQNKSMFLQISLPHPILAAESCPPCNIVLKLVMLMRTCQRKHTSLPMPLSLYHSWLASPGLQRTEC